MGVVLVSPARDPQGKESEAGGHPQDDQPQSLGLLARDDERFGTGARRVDEREDLETEGEHAQSQHDENLEVTKHALQSTEELAK